MRSEGTASHAACHNGNIGPRTARARLLRLCRHERHKMMGASYDWSADVKKLPMPVMPVFADNDSVLQKHIAEFFALIGGGVKEPGWQNTQLSKARRPPLGCRPN
jgi:hypothetical protein